MNGKLQSLIKSLLAKDKEGKHFIRVVEEVPEELTNATGTHSGLSLESLLSKVIVLDKNNNPALRLAKVEYGQTIPEFEKQKRIDQRKNLENRRLAREQKAKEQKA